MEWKSVSQIWRSVFLSKNRQGLAPIWQETDVTWCHFVFHTLDHVDLMLSVNSLTPKFWSRPIGRLAWIDSWRELLPTKQIFVNYKFFQSSSVFHDQNFVNHENKVTCECDIFANTMLVCESKMDINHNVRLIPIL